MRRLLHWPTPATLAAALVLLVLAGCSGRPAIEGTVTYAGQPVDGGSISFIPDNNRGTIASADIKAGKYAVPAGKGPGTGKCRVQIVWKKKTGRQVQTPGDAGNLIDETVQVIPANYNAQTTLSADLKSGGNTLNFDLK
jgi:hypothetical protein